MLVLWAVSKSMGRWSRGPFDNFSESLLDRYCRSYGLWPLIHGYRPTHYVLCKGDDEISFT